MILILRLVSFVRRIKRLSFSLNVDKKDQPE